MAKKRLLTKRKTAKTLKISLVELLVDWLNSGEPEGWQYRELVGEVVEKLNALRPAQKLFRKAPIESGKVGVPQGAEYHPSSAGRSFYIVYRSPVAEQWASQLRQLNESISRCFARPRFAFPVRDGWTVAWHADSDFGKHLARVVNNAGLIAHVRRCANCRKWFYADRLNQTCCSKKCRNEKYAKSPKGQARTRTRMKAYMRKRRQKKGKR